MWPFKKKDKLEIKVSSQAYYDGELERATSLQEMEDRNVGYDANAEAVDMYEQWLSDTPSTIPGPGFGKKFGMYIPKPRRTIITEHYQAKSKWTSDLYRAKVREKFEELVNGSLA